MRKMTKAQLVDENIALRDELDKLRLELKRLQQPSAPATTKPAPAIRPEPTFKRPIRVMSPDRGWAMRARAQLARDGRTVACQPITVIRCGTPQTVYAVF